ncbi:YdcH family protein [Elstera litoralis]
MDEVIARLIERPDGGADLLQIQRLKKRKLILKDQMHQLESALLPDIIA